MVLDSELVARLREILQSSDLNPTTPGTVRRQLEDFGVDLSDRKRFISQQFDEFLESHVKNEEGDEDGVADAEEEEVEINRTASAEEEETNEEEEEVANNKRSRKKA